MSDDELRTATLAVREAWREGDVERLVRYLSDTHPRVRSNAAWSLGLIGDARAVEPLLRLLHAGDEGVRLSALVALRRIGDGRAADGVHDVATGNDTFVVHYYAVMALGTIGDPRAVPLLVAMLTDPHLEAAIRERPSAYPATASKVRSRAADKLVELRATEAIPALERARHEASPLLRIRLSWTIRRLRASGDARPGGAPS